MSRIPHRPERDRMLFEVLHALKGLSPKEVAAKTWVSPQTIRKWRMPLDRGGVRYPRHTTLAAVARTAGLEFRLVRVNRMSDE